VRKAFLVIAAVEVALLLAVPAPSNPDKPGVGGGFRTAAALLRGDGPPVDLVQDYEGARLLVRGGDSYEVLTRAYAQVGLTWPAEHRSTHPPTAFVLVLPVSWLSWRPASALWAVLMLAAIGASWWALGARWELAVALAPPTLLWPPAAWSLGQLTPLWLLGLALAWRWRGEPGRAGAATAFAALTKLLPTLSLVPFLVLRRLRVVAGFAAVAGAALLVLLALRPGVVSRYVPVARATGNDQAARGENSSLLWAFDHRFGAAGVAVAVVLVVVVLARSILRLRRQAALDEWSWWAWGWGGVALLPIAWVYSQLPLLPALAYCVRRGGVLSHGLAAFAVSVPFLVDPFGLPGGIRLALGTASAGLALLAVRD
jgi:Glycosyltransferase family 87